MPAVETVNRLSLLFLREELDSLASGFYRGHLRIVLVWLEAQP